MIKNRKFVLYIILAAMVVVGGGIGGYFWYEGHYYVSTEDSRITGDIYKVMPRITGKVTSLTVREGDRVLADQIIGMQDANNLPTSSLEQATLRSPIEGIIIKTLVKEGEVASPGQAVAMVVNENQLYVTANIEETKILKVKKGQQVDIQVDTYPGEMLTGNVEEITRATNSTFSLLPATNTSGNFTKVTQRIPIKISLNGHPGLDLSPGMSATIKIHTKSE